MASYKGVFFYDCPGKNICFVECSPFEASAPLLAFGDDVTLTFLQRIPSKNESDLSWSFNLCGDLHLGSRCSAFAWSPMSASPSPNSPTAPIVLSFCVALGKDLIYHQRLGENSTQEQNDVSDFEPMEILLSGHTDSINAIAFSPDQPKLIASVSNDSTFRVWDLEGEGEVLKISLESPGISVSWCHPRQVVVCELNGNVHVIDIFGNVYAPTAQIKPTLLPPLTSSDTSFRDPGLTGCVLGGTWLVYEVRGGVGRQIAKGVTSQQPSTFLMKDHFAQKSNMDPNTKNSFTSESLSDILGVDLHSQAVARSATLFSWAVTTRNLFATAGSGNVTIWDITHPHTGHMYQHPSGVINDISWNGTCTCVVVAGFGGLSFVIAGV
eukprot:GCRY01003059.1.p1 GENE.GCRY01003059.1~~GCRY01003059.1.p1  ORF type:complete len:381 (-),score=25.29 GCRY01003059.1:130-1272(-)